MKRGIRNANIGIAVGMIVLVVGGIFFHDSDAAMEFLALGTFSTAMGVMFFLDWLDERAERKGSDRAH